MSALGQKQTCAAHKPMSAKCQMQTHPVYSITSSALKDGRAFVFTMSQVILIGMEPRKSRLPISTPQ